MGSNGESQDERNEAGIGSDVDRCVPRAAVGHQYATDSGLYAGPARMCEHATRRAKLECVLLEGNGTGAHGR